MAVRHKGLRLGVDTAKQALHCEDYEPADCGDDRHGTQLQLPWEPDVDVV